jgi:hypothetical protein
VLAHAAAEESPGLRIRYEESMRRMNDAGSPLSTERERDLVVAAEGGDEEACRQLIQAFLPAIRGLAHRFAASGRVQWSELIQEGIAGLLFATRRYDPHTGTPFWAYASFWVRKAPRSRHAVRHGTGVEEVRVGRVDGRFVCEVIDRGRGFDDPLAGYLVPRPGRGKGLWVASQLTWRLESFHSPLGFTVRLWL